MFRSCFAASSTIRRRVELPATLGRSARIDILEPRILPSVTAHNDTESLSSNFDMVTIYPTLNDTGSPMWIANATGGDFGSVTYDPIESTVLYQLDYLGTQDVFESIVDECYSNIDLWSVQQRDEYEAIKGAVEDAIDDFESFVTLNGIGTS
jgi:hypothetical protein